MLLVFECFFVYDCFLGVFFLDSLAFIGDRRTCMWN